MARRSSKSTDRQTLERKGKARGPLLLCWFVKFFARGKDKKLWKSVKMSPSHTRQKTLLLLLSTQVLFELTTQHEFLAKNFHHHIGSGVKSHPSNQAQLSSSQIKSTIPTFSFTYLGNGRFTHARCSQENDFDEVRGSVGTSTVAFV